MPGDTPQQPIELSVVVPAFNEAGNAQRLVEQVEAALAGRPWGFELVVVDDRSEDDTAAAIERLGEGRPWVVLLRHARRLGQSAAMYTGIQGARGRYVATLDADLQNDPADLPVFLERALKEDVGLVQGFRDKRTDSKVKLVTSRVGRGARKLILSDPIRDTGCSTRVIAAQYAKALPLYFHGMHRFVPVYCRAIGASVIELPARHHPRTAGVTKYGIRNRAWSGLMDCLAVRWMLRRLRTSPVHHDRSVIAGGSAAGVASSGPQAEASHAHA